MLLKIIEERAGVLQMSSTQIGSLLGLSETRVLRLFSAEVGKTLRRHLLEVRMGRAAESLRDGVMPIKTIAFHCGYSVVTNFYRDFKIVYGTSPMRMRLMHMNLYCATQNRVLHEPPVFGTSETPEQAAATYRAAPGA
jgi:AraC-like DNA-binding protein